MNPQERKQQNLVTIYQALLELMMQNHLHHRAMPPGSRFPDVLLPALSKLRSNYHRVPNTKYAQLPAAVTTDISS